MKALLKLLIYFVPLIGQTQETGILFRQDLSWSQIKLKAKAENKYIFLDCDASWCVPCKYMEKEVFSLKKAGDFFNDRFICVKVQMDTTKSDDQFIKKWYQDASRIRSEFAITIFPTYLYFDPNGVIVHREEGAKEVDELIANSLHALDSTRQFYTLLEKYKRGVRDTSVMRLLAKEAKNFGNERQAYEIANQYINKIPGKIALTKENVLFLGDFTKHLTDRGFKFFLDYSDTIDKITGIKAYADVRAMNIIVNEEKFVNEIFLTDKFEPNWKSIYDRLNGKYPQNLVERTMAVLKVRYYKSKRRSNEYAKYLIQYIAEYETNLHPLVWNNYAWEVFANSNDTTDLETALLWSVNALLLDGKDKHFGIDTYANILYKLGRRKEAIVWEEKAVAIKPGAYDRTLAKMKRGEKTW